MTYATTLPNNSIGGALDDVKIFESYIQKCLLNSSHGGLRCHRKDQIKDEILVGISTLSDSALDEWVNAIDATVTARCIDVRALQQMRARSEMIPMDRVWMLCDPCVTTSGGIKRQQIGFRSMLGGCRGGSRPWRAIADTPVPRGEVSFWRGLAPSQEVGWESSCLAPLSCWPGKNSEG
jgi:hypothetical protein